MGVAPDLPWEGGCRCGALRFRVTTRPLVTSVCHCRGCQQMTGGAFSTTVTVPGNGFELTKGEPVLGGLRGPVALHHHYDICKSWVFTRVDQDPSFVNVRPTQLDEAAWFAPYLEMYTSEKLAWAETGAPRRFSKFPAPDDFPALLAEYAGWAQAQGPSGTARRRDGRHALGLPARS